MIQGVRLRPSKSEAGVLSLASSCDFLMDELALGSVFLSRLRFPPVSIVPLTIHTHFNFNPLKTKRRQFHLKTQFVPHSKHF